MGEEQVFWTKTVGRVYHVFRQVKANEPYVWNPSRSLCNSYWLEGRADITARPSRKCSSCQKKLEKIFKLINTKMESQHRQGGKYHTPNNK